MTKRILLALACLAFVSPAFGVPASAAPAPAAVEDWKGQSDPARFNLGGFAGMGTIDSQAGFALLGLASAKVVDRGFVPDINDSASIEVQAGPLFVASTASFMYSAHLRWNFEKDENWGLYAIGGLSGHVTGSSLGSRFIMFPRFGIGGLWWAHPLFQIRAELSRELIAVGPQFSF